MKGYPHEALGRILLDLGRLDEAVASAKSRRRTRSRIRSGTYESWAGYSLPGVIFRQPSHPSDPAREASPTPPFRRSAADMVREVEGMIALEPRLPALVRNEDHLTTVPERIRLARLCQIKHLFATSAAIWDELFAAEPRLAARTERRASILCRVLGGTCGVG